MNIMYVCGDPREKVFGGVEEHSNNLIDYLSKRSNIEIHVLKYGG